MKKVWIAASAFACALTGIVAVACGDEIEEVSYKFDTQCEVTVADVTVNKGEEFTLPTPPSRGKEWEFAGWYLSNNFSGAPVTSVIADMGTTYYAKWDRRYKITLDLNGGSLSGADDLYLKAGENVSAYLSSYVPAKDGFQFGQWLNGASALGGNFRMPSGELALTARYKVAYTLDVYTQNLSKLLADKDAPDYDQLPEYDKESLTLYEYATDKFTVDYTLQGFTEVEHEGEELSGKIVENPTDEKDSDNRFAVYFNREQYVVTLDPNVAGTAQQAVSDTFYYGQEYELPYDLYTNVGYIFAGWSESAFGQNDYPIDYIDAILYNKESGDKSEIKREKPYFVEGDATLYAYWNKGYSDLFGSADTIFLMDGKPESVYLLRGGMYFKGQFDEEEENVFLFNENPDDLTWGGLITGKILNGDKFCYAEASLDGRSYSHYTRAAGMDRNYTLTFTDYNTLEAVVKGENSEVKAYGTYEVDFETGEYIAYFTSGNGDLVGRTIRFQLGTVVKKNSTEYSPVFTVRNEDDVALGTIQRLGLANATTIGSFSPNYDLSFDGYGVATLNYGGTLRQLYYNYNAETEIYTLTTGSSTFGSIKLVNEGGFSGYMFYDADLAGAYEMDGGTLTLDGMMHARFESGASDVTSGYYSLTSSCYGGYILTMTGSGRTYTFLMKSNRSFITGKTTYTAERKPNGYLEYYYYGGKNSKGEDAFYEPMLVLNDEEENKANLYERIGGVWTKIASGTYEQDEKSGLYVFTFTDKTEGIDHSASKYDITDMSAFVFGLNSTLTSNRIYYNYSVTGLPEEGSEEKIQYVEYTPDQGYPNQKDTKLTVIGGIAVLDLGNDGASVIGTISTTEWEGTTVTVLSTGSGYIYMEIDEDAKTFFRYETTIGTTYLYKEDGTWEKYTTLTLNGKGGAVYTIPNPDATGKDDATISYNGTVRALEGESTIGGAIIYEFTETKATEDKLTFRYILLSDSNRAYFSMISTKEGEFKSDTEGTLELDGTGFNLIYTDTYNRTYSGQYRARSENVIYTYINGEYLYFEIDSKNGTFRLLNNVYGMYMVMDNQYADGRSFEFDGKNGVTISKLVTKVENEGTEDEKTTSSLEKIADGTYTEKDGLITVTYTTEIGARSVDVTVTGRVGSMKIGNYLYATFFVSYDSAADTFVNEADYSVLVFDDAGNAIRYTQTGRAERGSYTLIADESTGSDYNILYYVNSAGTYATIYEYDVKTHLIVAVDNKGESYFNQNFESLRFTAYGFAVFNGTERYYYYDEGENVAIYRPAAENVEGERNRYGYIKTDIGAFDETIEWGTDQEGADIVYYKNKGFDLMFKRESGNADLYPVTFKEGGTVYKLQNVKFSPSGNTTFSVSGTATLSYQATDAEENPVLKTEERDCTVVRKALTGEGQSGFETYVMIGDFRFDFTPKYDPEPDNRFFTVEKMSIYIDAESYTFLYNVEQFYPTYGSQIVQMLPDFGHITITREYNTDGTPNGGYKLSGEIGETMKFLDANGKLIESFEDLDCTAEIIEETENSKGSETYTVTLKGDDGYTYEGVYAINRGYGVPAFSLLGFYRKQTITSGNCSVTVGRIIISENQQSYAPGTIIVPEFTDNGQKIENASIFGSNGKLNLVTREKDDDGKIVSSTYYQIILEEKSDGSIDDDVVLPYDEAKCSIKKIENVKTVYAENGTDYVDLVENSDPSKTEILVYCLYGRYNYVVTDTKYDADKELYIITTSSAKYTVKITEGEGGTKTAAIEKYTEPETVS